MNSRQLLLASALVGGLLSSASATTRVAPSDYAAPVPTAVVAPTGLPRSHIGAIVTLRLNVDATGQPSNIRVLSDRDPALTQRLVEAVSQWRFSPARQNGIAVGATIELPLELQEG
jgi:protein TonB